MPDDSPSHDLAGQHPALAGAPGGAQAPDTPGGDSARCGPEHGIREGTGAGGEDSRDTRPGNATRYVETTRGILSYAELAPLLAERVALVELALYEQETFAAAPLDEHLLLDLHRRIAGELVPEWAGRWRDIAVTVGRLEPPQPFQVPMLMRDYALDLQARWPAASICPAWNSPRKPKPVAPNTSPRWKLPMAAFFIRPSHFPAATASPTPSPYNQHP